MPQNAGDNGKEKNSTPLASPKTKKKNVRHKAPEQRRRQRKEKKNSTPQISNKLQKKKKCRHKPQNDEEKIRTKDSRRRHQ